MEHRRLRDDLIEINKIMKGKGKVSLFLRVGESKGRGHGLMCEGKDLKGQLFPEGGAYLE